MPVWPHWGDQDLGRPRKHTPSRDSDRAARSRTPASGVGAEHRQWGPGAGGWGHFFSVSRTRIVFNFGKYLEQLALNVRGPNLRSSVSYPREGRNGKKEAKTINIKCGSRV